MPSEARRRFDRNCRDVEYLFQLEPRSNRTTGGASKDVAAKSAVVLITAFWEAYCEDLAAEALSHLVAYAKSSEDLPIVLRKRVAKELENDPHDLAVWKLSGEGWRAVLEGRLAALQDERNRRLNNPKTENIDQLFEESLGIMKVSSKWRWEGMTPDRAAKKLDAFVTLRGDIAHRGRAAEKVSIQKPKVYLKHVRGLVSKTGASVNSVVRKVTGHPLWITTLSSVFESVDEPEITRMIRHLKEPKRKVLELRFGLDNRKAYGKDREIKLRTLKEVGEIMNLDSYEVLRIESEGIRELRLALKNTFSGVVSEPES